MLKSRSRCRMQWSDIVLWLEGLPTEIHSWSSNWIEGNGVIFFCDWQDFQFRFTVGPPTGSNEMEWSCFVIGMTSNWDSQLALQLDRMKSSLSSHLQNQTITLLLRRCVFATFGFFFFLLIFLLRLRRGVKQKIIRKVNYKAAGTVIDFMAIDQFFLQRR